ncbi:hypothetical protein T10_4621 [Trichinella papuae]|uniref:Uncharacterized protein n=1 Tax=Trichinella papuae TaxID=268474 RepID=A0A0V1N2E9_9BILA|nr:hypothetical protein T10_4621 [Trichinella papuae]
MNKSTAIHTIYTTNSDGGNGGSYTLHAVEQRCLISRQKHFFLLRIKASAKDAFLYAYDQQMHEKVVFFKTHNALISAKAMN